MGLVLLGSDIVTLRSAIEDAPFSVPHCIPTHTTQAGKSNVLDQMLSNQVTMSLHVERERAYNSMPSLMKIPYLDETASFSSASRKMGKIQGYNQPSSTTKKDTVFTRTNVYEAEPSSSTTSETFANRSEVSATRAAHDVTDSKDTSETKCKCC